MNKLINPYFNRNIIIQIKYEKLEKSGQKTDNKS